MLTRNCGGLSLVLGTESGSIKSMGMTANGELLNFRVLYMYYLSNEKVYRIIIPNREIYLKLSMNNIICIFN